jgi:hypothetical protein
MNWIIRNNFGYKKKSNGVVIIQDLFRKQQIQNENNKNSFENKILKKNLSPIEENNSYKFDNNKTYQQEFYQIHLNNNLLLQLKESESIIKKVINIPYIENMNSRYIE